MGLERELTIEARLTTLNSRPFQGGLPGRNHVTMPASATPGLGIIRRDPTTQEWTLAHVLPSTVLDDGQTRNNSDPHAVILRRNTSVPGPLPGLGVGLAVAFSRRLRRRISLRGGAAAGGSRPG